MISYTSFCKRGSPVSQTVKNLPAMQKTQVPSLGREDPLEKEMANPLQYSCLKNSMDCRLRSLVGNSLSKPQ